MSVTTQIWLHKLNRRPATRESQSRTARHLLQLACQSHLVELNARHLELPGPALIRLLYKDFGLRISITHCPRLVAVALGKGPLGLDCEPLGRKRNWQRIADHFFTPEEAKTIADASIDERERVFLRHWVLKESYIKCFNGSVFGDLNRLALTDLGETALVERRDDHNCRWAWVGSFAGCVLGMYSSDACPPNLAFYETSDTAGTSSMLSHEQVPGTFVSVS